MTAIWFVRASIRTTDCLLGMPTQMLPSPEAISCGPLLPVCDTRIVFMMSFVFGSMRETVPA